MLGGKVQHLGRGATATNERSYNRHLTEEQCSGGDDHERLGHGQHDELATVGDQGEELAPVGVLVDAGTHNDIHGHESSLELVRVLGAKFEKVVEVVVRLDYCCTQALEERGGHT